MRIEYQEDILRFLVQSKDGKKFIPIIDEAAFDISEHQIVYDLILKYTEKYSTVPKKAGLLQFFDKQVEKVKINKEVYNEIDKTIRLCYDPFEGDTAQIRESLIEHAQYKKAKKMIQDFGPKLKDGVEVFKKMEREMLQITKMAENFDVLNQERGGFVLKDHGRDKASIVHGEPTYLKSLNKMTAAGGFYSPQLIIFMGGPKSFKTGAVMNVAAEYMRDGLNGYYVDMENGKRSIRTRFKQQMSNLTLGELISREHDVSLADLSKRYMAMGGDIVVEYYPANIATTKDVDADLTMLYEEHGWKPDFIVWDYPDKMNCEDKTVKDPRLKIQHVYHDIIRLHNKWDCFGLGISPVNRNAVGKTIIDMKDFAEDFGKAYNAHAAFALCATPEEEKAHIRRIVPVFQREGVPASSGKAWWNYHLRRQTK